MKRANIIICRTNPVKIPRKLTNGILILNKFHKSLLIPSHSDNVLTTPLKRNKFPPIHLS